jgi:uncharacterized protein (DUF1800 family)
MIKKNFFRKVALGIGPNEKIPSEPVSWAQNQVDKVPSVIWDEPIRTGEEMLNYYAEWVYTDREILRKKHKGNRKAYDDAKNSLRNKVGERYFENLEICIRHNTVLNSGAPVFERLWLFWCNHFAIIDKDFMPEFTTGPYHRETIRKNMCGSFETLLKEATLGWSMIHNLDNSESIGPSSEWGQNRRKRGKLATVNENHARELLELHTISPSAGYTQEDVVQLSYIMAGWEHRHTKKRKECNEVRFNQKKHEPGDHKVLGKTYKQKGWSSKNKLLDVLKDLASHPETIRFISFKLCRHFITDHPTQAMMEPVMKAWEQNNGNLRSIHKALLKVVYEYADKEMKFQNPEIWMLQMVHMVGGNWPNQASEMKYNFKFKPNNHQRKPRSFMKEIGYDPYRAIQPNGYSDLEDDWISPELLIRRFSAPKSLSRRNIALVDFEQMIDKNFDNPKEMKELVNKIKSPSTKMQLIFPSYRMLKA